MIEENEGRWREVEEGWRRVERGKVGWRKVEEDVERVERTRQRIKEVRGRGS